MNISIGHIDKRLNSTKRTATWDVENLDVKLKEPTDVKQPVFLIRRTALDDQGEVLYELDPANNYVYSPDWGYYWIDDIVYYTNELIELHCHRDVLATGHDYITSSEAYIKFCSDAKIAVDYKTMDDPRLGPDKFIGQEIDNLADVKTVIGTEQKTFLNEWFVNEVADGTVVVSLVGTGAGCLQWFMTPYQYYLLLAGAATGAGVNSIDVLVSKFLGSDWRACLNYATYMPLDINKLNDHFTSSDNNILWGSVQCSMGSDQIHYTLLPFTAYYKTTLRNIKFTKLAEKDGYQFLKGTKYSKVFLESPAGSQDISNDAFISGDDLYIQECIDFINGNYTMKVYLDNYTTAGVPLAAFTEQLGIDVTGISKQMPSSFEQFSGMVAGATKAAARVALFAGAGMIAAGNAAVASGNSAGAAYGAGFSGKEAIAYEMKNFAPASAKGAMMASGIEGAFSGGAVAPSGAGCRTSGGITSYFTCDYQGTSNGKNNFRIVTSTAAPALIADEDITEDDPIEMPKWAAKHGYPCNKWSSLSKVAEGSYIETCALSMGDVSDPEFTLLPSEISELNSMLNSGIFLDEVNAAPEPEPGT